MADLTLAHAQTIITAALAHARSNGLNTLAVAVLDSRGALKAFAAEDGTSLNRGEMARGKANGAVALGMGSRALHRMATERPHFVEGLHSCVNGPLLPVPGGVLIRDASGVLVGAVGISGDTSDKDEDAACAGIAAAGLVADMGQ
ncbi:heme-binding protein [uncultured Alsobacter sp.]|uniref:GlcG/HbpS family heme-binding protein n=1 Tax=uncultured Alsobacter sp. TaxID=1748258 RepID=UPI002600340F|nr:heme-binding protein [uncultured Alsobacter sp.]